MKLDVFNKSKIADEALNNLTGGTGDVPFGGVGNTGDGYGFIGEEDEGI